MSTIFAKENLPSDTVVAWTADSYGDNYAVNRLDDTIDIVSAYRYYSNHTGELDCVVGSGKQLDHSNIHYTVNIQFGDLQNWLGYTLYDEVENGSRSLIRVITLTATEAAM